MRDADKSKEQLITELKALRQRVAELEKDKGTSTDPAELRRRAEQWLKAKQTETDQRETNDTERQYQELATHQIELEMQNEELRNAMVQIEESRTRYSNLYDFAPIGYLTLDENGLILEANLTIARQLGIERSRLVGRPLPAYIVIADRDAFRSHLSNVLKDKTHQACEVRFMKGNGGDFHALLDAIFVMDAVGERRVRTSVTDITKRKRAEAALLESEHRVRRLNEHILNMVTVMSHDIRGPLVAIASILKLMLRGVYGKLDQSPANTVQDLLSRCARLLGTAEDYLGKASIVEGSMEMKREVLDLRQDIIDAVLDELADDITKREIVIDNRLGAIPSGSITITANKTWLKSVYRNLFTNAVKFGGKGCTISFGFEQHESHYRLNVYNSGIPIAEKDREKIFHRFERIEPLEGPAPEGVGLGLSLCKEIIIKHGGEIWYEARPDGSNFVFTIPREDECEA